MHLVVYVESQTEEGSATAEREKNLELGAATAMFALAILLGWVCLPKEAKHPGNVRLTVSLLLSFATFLCGDALMLVNFGMLTLRDREHLISGGQCAAAKCLRPACHVMMGLTLLSLLALLPGGVHLYVGLGFVVVIVSVAGGVHRCLRHYYRGGAGEVVADDEEETIKKLDAASKVTSAVTYAAFGGIVGVLFNASKVSSSSSQAAAAVDTAAAYAAIFSMFATAILGMFVTTVSKKVPEIRNPACRRVFVAGVRIANAFLLCALACAALAASYTVLRLRVLAAFAPLAAVSFLLRHCVARRRGHAAAGGGGGGEGLEAEARVKAMEDVASKVMVATLGGVMSDSPRSPGHSSGPRWRCLWPRPWPSTAWRRGRCEAAQDALLIKHVF
ncbi:unnamed protein product [Urochloa humidicola]